MTECVTAEHSERQVCVGDSLAPRSRSYEDEPSLECPLFERGVRIE